MNLGGNAIVRDGALSHGKLMGAGQDTGEIEAGHLASRRQNASPRMASN